MNDSASYAIDVEGHLDAHWTSWLGHTDLQRNPDGTTTFQTLLIDQAQLHGILGGLRDMGTEIVGLRRTEAEQRAPSLARPLTTARLVLRAATANDAEQTWRYRRLPEVAEWLTELPADREAYRRTFADPARLAVTVVVECDGVVIGDFMLRVEDAWAQAEVREQARATQAELGWTLDPAYTGRGYATEAASALLDYCFDELGVRRVTANCFADNSASVRLIERLGLRREQHAVRESLHRTGEWLDTLTYALLADEPRQD